MEKSYIENSIQKTLKEKRYEELVERSMKIYSAMDFSPSRYFKSFYTRIESPLGWSMMANTPLAGKQLVFALAMSNNKEIEKLINENKELNSETLRQANVLQGMKILDLGCGLSPTFARSARRLGADVFTVDIVSSDEFKLFKPSEEFFNSVSDESKKIELKQLLEEFKETQKLEKEKHIQLDLNDPMAIKIIKNKSGGQFDLITEAHLFSGSSSRIGPETKTPSFDIKEKIKDLLKKDGIFYSSF